MAGERGTFKDVRVAVHVCGGIAAVKVPGLVTELRRQGAEVRVALTEAAAAFVSPLSLQALSGHPVRRHLLDPQDGGQGAGMPHLDLAAWADIHLVVPATAGTLAKMAAGLADDVVSSTLLATAEPILVAPAMETKMWAHPATRSNCQVLLERGVHFVGPAVGRLASGKEGEGRMAEPPEILAAAAVLLQARLSLSSRRVLVTSGGTREPIDPVRFLGNHSSGRMGLALAEGAAQRGATVSLVTTAALSPSPAGIEVVRVETAQEMLDAVVARLPRADLVLMAAAVADYRVASPSPVKLHRSDAPYLTLELAPTPDILGEVLAHRPPDCRVVGFAAETEDVRGRGLAKLIDKGCDMLVANPVAGDHSAMGGERAEAVALMADGRSVEIPWASKDQVASRILDLAEELLGVASGATDPE
ncbi:MAG: bifunctional phosphopantothenoylcysteine decarboxylase/phosphopantothenate--cysteine ligase CoaBC [Candidatus Dormibacteria bacterium]